MASGAEVGRGHVVITPVMDDAALSSVESKGSSSGKEFGNAFSVAAGNLISGAVEKLGSAIAGTLSNAFTNYADYEQLVGGIDTLFKESSGTVQKNAAEAFKSAGMSANEYMEQVTSFSASLLQGLGGDTQKAAEYADMAVRDMSDNANKMGTDMGRITDAYQGFAKQNYTMLDNLKLGYGGTKSEMERLLADASKIAGVEFNIDNYNDVIEAIHVMQENMGIAGTTAEEAQHTISGSINQLKASWQNFLTGIFDENADIGALGEQLFESIGAVLQNVVPRIGVLVQRLVMGLPSAIMTALQAIPEMLAPVINELFGKSLGGQINEALGGAFGGLSETLQSLLGSLGETFMALWEVVQPIIAMLGELFATVMPIIQDAIGFVITFITENVLPLVTEIAGIIQPVIEQIASSITAHMPEIQAVIQTVMEVVKGVIETVWPYVQEIIVGAVQAISAIILTAWPVISEAISIATGVIQAVIETAWPIIQGIIEGVMTAIQIVTETVWPIIQGVVETSVGVIMTVISGIESVVKTVTDIFNGIKSAISNPIGAAKNAVSSAVGAIGDFLGFDGLSDSVSKLFDGIGTFMSDPIGTAKDAISGAADAIGGFLGFDGLGDAVSTLFDDVGGFMSDPIGTAKDTIDSLASDISGFLEFSGLGDTVSGVFDAVQGFIEDPLGSAQEFIEGFADTIEGIFGGLKLELPDIALPHFNVWGGEFPFGIGGQGSPPEFSVDWYAKGGFVDGATLIGAGEKGPEMILPRQGGLMNEFADAVAARNDNGEVIELLQQILGKTGTVYIDGKQAGKILAPTIDTEFSTTARRRAYA